MDIDRIMEVVRPIIGVFGLLVFTHGLGRLVAASIRGDLSRAPQVRKATMFLFWVFFFVYILEPGPVWAQLVLLLVALFYLTAVFSAPLRRTVFRQRGSESDAA
jgi:hypothetical protein